MNRKFLLLSLASICVGFLPVRAQSSGPVATAPGFSTTLTSSVVSQYMFRGQRFGGTSFQPAVEVASGDLTLGLWANFPVMDKVAGLSDPEIDPYGSYTFKVNDAFSVVPGFTYYVYPHANTSAGIYKQTFEPSLALNYTYEGIKFTPKLYYDFVLEAVTAELTAAYAIPLKDIGSEIDLLGTYGTYGGKDFTKDATPSVKGWGDYWLVGVTMPFQVTKESKLTLGLAYTQGDNAYFKQGKTPRVQNTLAVGRAVFSVTYSFAF